MKRGEIQKLYQSKIIPESREPYHFEEKVDADLIINANNPMCGDKFDLYLDIDKDKIAQVYFHGIGCAISKASTSLLLREISDMGVVEAKEMIKLFLKALNTGKLEPFNDELRVLLELRNFEGRLDCIKLSWEELLNKL